MPRYLVERSFPDPLTIAIDESGAQATMDVVKNNATESVTWVHSYVTPDRTRSYCIYDGPDPESIRITAELNMLPVDSITEVRVLDPYFYHP